MNRSQLEDKLEHAERILNSVAIDIDEYFNNKPVEKRVKATKKATKTPKNGKVLECKYCSTTGFKWGETDKGWRLFDEKSGKEHVCKGA